MCTHQIEIRKVCSVIIIELQKWRIIYPLQNTSPLAVAFHSHTLCLEHDWARQKLLAPYKDTKNKAQDWLFQYHYCYKVAELELQPKSSEGESPITLQTFFFIDKKCSRESCIKLSPRYFFKACEMYRPHQSEQKMAPFFSGSCQHCIFLLPEIGCLHQMIP